MPRSKQKDLEEQEHDDGYGHNSAGSITADHLRQYVERIERLEEEKTITTVDIREVYAEAKSNGFDTKIMREVIKRRKLDAADREEQDALLELYEGTLAGRIARLME